MHIVLGVVKEYMADTDEKKRIKKMHGDNEEDMHKLYSELESKWT
jgi:hypothetical protein